MLDNFKIIYLYGYSPKRTIYLETLYPLLTKQVSSGLKLSLVLIHDGVIAASSRVKIPEQFKNLFEIPITVYVIKSDLKARGIPLDTIKESIKQIDYVELVELMDNSEKIISWM